MRPERWYAASRCGHAAEHPAPRSAGRAFTRGVLLVFLVTATAGSTAEARQLDLALLVGRAYPLIEERLAFRPPDPSLPGVDVGVSGDPVLRVDGGAVFGAVLGVNLGVIGVEARVDATDVGFDLRGARYEFRPVDSRAPQGAAALAVGNGRFDARRFYLVSGNVRVRTPGATGLIMSGGLSVLPDVAISGSVPLAAEIGGFPVAGIAPRVRLRIAPGQSEHRIGGNAGIGLQVGAGPIALRAEVRVFAFRDYDLHFDVVGAPDHVEDLLDEVVLIRFQPVIVNAQAGLVLRF